MFFTNAKSLIVKGRSRVIDVSDRLDLPDEINPKIFTWDENKVDWSNGKTIYFSLFRQTKIIIIKAVIFQIVGSLFAFATPLLIHEFIEKLQTNDWSEQNIFYLITLAIGFGLCGAGNGVSIQHYFYQILSFYQIATNLINKKLFSHSLKISNSAKQKYQIGDVVNFMSSDAEAIGDAAMTTIDLVNAVVLLVGCSTLLFYYLGWSALVAIFVMIILVPMTQLLAKKFIVFQDEMMSYRDQRMTLLTQVLSAIRVVKYFSWEKSVAAEVDAIRGLEIKSRVKLAKAEVAWGLIYASISSVVLFSALVTHYLRGFEIKLSLVLTCLAIFSIMEDHFGGLSRFIGRFISIFVSGDRMASYISSDVILSEENVQKGMDEGVCVDCRNVDFSYDGKNKLFQKLNFKIELGQSVAVVGPVGIGKSTLLQLLLHELYPQAGQVSMLPLKKAYVSQETFIINTSLKENIIFGHGEAVDPNLLDKAIEYSCLKYDLQLLDHQLDTEIGERGVNLSGGQKQRVSLARAIYSQADIILMDDPLSAVDPDTEDKLSRELIFGLWNSKTRIVVTHRIAHIKNYDRILFLQNDHYKFGTYEELYNNSEEFRKFLDLEIKNKTDEDEIKEKINQIPPLHSESTSSGRVTVDEDRATGSVDKAVYFSYLKALGGDSKYRYLNLIILFLSTICAVAFTLIQKAWLTQMATKVSTDKLVIGYGLFGLSVIFVSFLSNSFWAYRGVMAGRRFHQNMMKSILSARIRFFDSTPIGRILQRFSRDIEFVDLYVQWDVSNAINALFNILTSTLLIVVTVPITILLLSPALIYFYFVQRDYRHVAREIKRLDSLARSPKYAHFKETLNGLQVIRSYSQQKWFTKEFLTKITNSTQMFYTHYMLNRWFSTRLPMIGGVISIVASISVVFATKNNYIGAGLAGLITLYALDFWRHLNWGVRIFSDLESKMTSVERLEYYANLPEERDSVAISDFEKNQDYKSWPRTGDLEFKNVYLKYADHLPFVLKNVSFKIKSGLRVGIIGRTGSGKSTLFQAVYRFVDYQSGDILIDGLSIQSVPLERLRKNLAVIPQDPSLFMGSLRSNLDRYSEKTDTEIWDVLHKVGLKPFVENLPLQLSATVTENGSNLSQGQRQLICLARALLMKVKIIFLDEATASIDLETDALVQKVIRESLSGITLVTIAHRIATLKDYDQIIELQNGQVMR